MRDRDLVDIVAGSLEDAADGLQKAPLPHPDPEATRQFDIEFIREVARRVRKEAST